ncbi:MULTISPECIES: potassium transporter TrkG [unclassified Ruegeria]|uniref:TrkH family potassium uptake protein n=1 Tax=unclassified Ruegeria TaxID=2625375 RepID=UPI001ADC0E2B|nr:MULTISPECIES: potassium transporter TrkG [unclassified Ruegeria]MBO9410571.1 TrkH family potassium uptake protein [Ruegeria sp. R8_1]MBO9414210.1 TrkH family potassium uptake protein [Ruegeria sp. R8_2]
MARVVAHQIGLVRRLPLFLLIWGIAAVSMWIPAAYALALNDHDTSRSFFYSGLLGLFVVATIALASSNRIPRRGTLGQLAVLLACFTVLPLFLAVPLHDAMGNTTFLNAYFDMVSAMTTTGADIFPDPERLSAPLHLWRAQVGWMGGLLMWISAAAILAPLSLGGFEVTARGQPGRPVTGVAQSERVDPRGRLIRVTRTLSPIYAGLTLVICLLLLITGETGLTAICHAMSTMATSGISPVGGLEGAQAGITGEAIIFLFLFFALSRLTFSTDTATTGYSRLDKDPEFRIGLMIVVAVAALLFTRVWAGVNEIGNQLTPVQALSVIWGMVFTVLSFLTTAGFESANWNDAQQLSGLGTPGLVLLGIALIGGGVATTAGGVKLLRVFALYLNGAREIDRLIYPSSVSGVGGGNKRIQSDGAFIAWIFLMMFALTAALFNMLLAAMGAGFEQAMVLTVAALSTTGPLIELATDVPIRLVDLSEGAKLTMCAAMVIGRLETLAIIALITPSLWRD